MRDVVAIGSTTLDLFFKTRFDVIRWPKTPLGKALVVPLGEKFGTEDVHITIGGNAANAAVTFARQGFSCALFTKIGNDIAGREVLRTLRREHVGATLVEVTPRRRTSQSILLLQKGERSIITYHGAIDEFTLRRVRLDALKAAWWYVSLPGDSYKAFNRLLSYATRHGIKVALNPSYKHLVGAGRQQLVKHLKKLALLVLNEGEAALLTGIPFRNEKKVFKVLDNMVPGIVAVTQGQKGSMVSDGHHIYHARIFKEHNLADRTGAGDAFGAGFVAGLVRTGEQCAKGICNPRSISYALRLASANAASVIERIGATEGTLTRKQFETSSRWRRFPVSVKKIKA
jgi:sugar/nucleoside kinase (ribokinase family)